MASTLETSALNLANHQASGVWSKAIKSGVLAQLSASDPELKVGSTDFFTFNTTPKAELVGEGANKDSQDATPSKATAKTYKVHVTYRMTDEVLYSDEDYQIGLVDALVGRIGTALSRALDLLAIHGVNPATGTVSSAVTEYLTKASNGVHVIDDAADAQAGVVAAAVALQGAGYSATGIGFDPAYAGELARTTVGSGDARQLYPELGLGFNVSSFQGLTAASSDTVSGKNEISGGTDVRAVMGDFNAFKWGVARNVPLETIRFGDPDGGGDLKRTNEIAIRAESYIGFAFLDTAAFAVIEQAEAAE